MIETNLPQSGDDNAHSDSSGKSKMPAIPAGDTDDSSGESETTAIPAGDPAGDPVESSSGTDEPQPDQKYFPAFSRKRMTRRQWQLAFTLMGASILISVVVVASNLVTVPYVSISPGSVYSLSEAVSVDGGDGEFAIYPPESDMGFVTVRRSERLNIWRLFFDSLDSRVDIRRDDINRGLTEQQLDRLRALQMLGSQGDAVEIALRHLGRTRVTLLLDPQSDSFIDTLLCFVAESDDDEVSESLQRFRQDLLPVLPDGGMAFNQTAGLRFLANSQDGFLRGNLEGYWRAFNKLFIGDTVISANGMPIGDTADLRAALQGVEPGETVILETQFFEQPVRRVSAKLGESLEDGPGTPVLTLEDVAVSGGAGEGGGAEAQAESGTAEQVESGTAAQAGSEAQADSETAAQAELGAAAQCPDSQSWQFFDWPDWELVTRVNFDTGNVGGPSAGLAFALAVVDLLTEGDLTGGLRVATTGIFSSATSDSVSSVGGVPQKTAAVRNSGYDVFLVPENDYDDAISAAGDDLRVEKVTTLRDALATLECLGGDPVLLGDESPGSGASEAAAGLVATEIDEVAACS